jgi:transcriptional regulator with XRE-family HTH domain
MSPDDLQRLRRGLRLTQVQFADRLGVSAALVVSMECGRRRITESRAEQIARLFGGGLYKRQAAAGQHAVATTAYNHTPSLPQAPAPIPKTRAGPMVLWAKCTWREPEGGVCGGLTPQGMLYCALHMALALIEGRPTRPQNR